MCAKCVVHSRPASSPALAANTLPLQTQSNRALRVTPELNQWVSNRASGESSGIDSPATPVRTTMAPSGNWAGSGSRFPSCSPIAASSFGVGATKRSR